MNENIEILQFIKILTKNHTKYVFNTLFLQD